MTVDDIMSQMMSQVIGGMPVLNMFQPQIKNLLYDQLGLAGTGYRDTFLDTVMMSNMTPYGQAMDLENRRIQQVAADATKLRNIRARQGFFADMGRTMMSFDSWRDIQRAQNVAEDQLTQANYDSFIQNEARGRAANPVWNFLYNTVDPDGLGAANTYLSQAGANQIRHGRWAGRRGAMLEARAIGDLFIGADGQYDFDKAQYGHMNVGEASAVAASLTKDIDFFQGLGGTTPEKMKQAAENLRNTVKEYTKALAPLKDIFGTDVPAMITAIEDLSGQKLSQLDPVHMGDLVKRVMAGATAGNYSLGQLQGQREAISRGLLSMNVPYVNDLSALSQAMTVLDMTVSGPGPSFMSRERFNQMAGDLVVRSSASAGATAINQAYAVWRGNQSAKDIEGLTQDEIYQKFRNEYDALRTGPNALTADEALLRLSKQSSMYNLEVAGTGSQYYRDAVEANLGGTQAIRENLNSYISTARTRAINEQHGAAFNEAIAAVQGNVALLSNTDLLMKSDLSAEAKAEVLRISNGHYGADLSMGLVAYDQADKSRQRTQRQIQAMNSAAVLRALPDDAKSLMRDYLGGKLDFAQLLDRSKDLRSIRPEDQEMLKSSLEAAKMLGGLAKLTGEDLNKFQESFVTYSLNNGPTNALFTQHQMEFEDLMRRAENPAEGEDPRELQAKAQQAANMMDLYRYIDEGVATEWLAGLTPEERVAKERDIMANRKINGKPVSSQIAGQEATDMMRMDLVERQMRQKGLSSEYVSIAMKGLRAGSSELGIFDSAKAKEILRNNKELESMGGAEALDKAIMSVNEGYGKEGSLETILTENTNLISKLLRTLDEYFNKEGENKTVEAQKAAKNQNNGTFVRPWGTM